MAQPSINAAFYKLGASQDLASGAASVQSAPFTAGCKAIRVSCTVACRFLIGANPTALATSPLLMPADAEYFAVEGAERIAVIQEAAGGKVSIVELQS